MSGAAQPADPERDAFQCAAAADAVVTVVEPGMVVRLVIMGVSGVEPDSGEDPLTLDVGPAAGQIARQIIRLLAASVKIDESATSA